MCSSFPIENCTFYANFPQKICKYQARGTSTVLYGPQNILTLQALSKKTSLGQMHLWNVCVHKLRYVHSTRRLAFQLGQRLKTTCHKLIAGSTLLTSSCHIFTRILIVMILHIIMLLNSELQYKLCVYYFILYLIN